jgi:hypothetical protein
MQITRRSPFTGVEHTLDIPVTQKQIADWNNGALIQNAMPNISPEHREFIMTGITPQEWDGMFGDPQTQDGPELDEDFDADWRDEPLDPGDPYDIEYDR